MPPSLLLMLLASAEAYMVAPVAPKRSGRDVRVVSPDMPFLARHARHPSHWSLDEALEWIERLKPRRAILTNMHVDLDYAALRAKLPPHIEPAYDGMRLVVG